MHSANFTAFSTLAAVLPPPLLPEPVAAGAFEPHALIRATMAIRARAASGRSFLLMASPRSPRAPMIAAMTTAIARRIVDRVRLLAVLVRCRSRLQSRQRDVVSTYVFFDMPTICSGAGRTRLGGALAFGWAPRHADRLRCVRADTARHAIRSPGCVEVAPRRTAAPCRSIMAGAQPAMTD